MFVVTYTLLALLTNILWCQPIEGSWDRSIKARCYSINLVIGFALSNSCKHTIISLAAIGKANTDQGLCYVIAFSIFSDVVLAVIPVPIIWNLQMARKLRLYLIGVMSLGYLCVLAVPRFDSHTLTVELVVPLRCVRPRCTISSIGCQRWRIQPCQCNQPTENSPHRKRLRIKCISS